MGVFGHRHEAGGPPVQTVDRVEGGGEALVPVVGQEEIGQGVPVVPLAGVDGDAPPPCPESPDPGPHRRWSAGRERGQSAHCRQHPPTSTARDLALPGHRVGKGGGPIQQDAPRQRLGPRTPAAESPSSRRRRVDTGFPAWSAPMGKVSQRMDEPPLFLWYFSEICGTLGPTNTVPRGRPPPRRSFGSFSARFWAGRRGGRSLSRPVVQPRRRHRQCPHRPGLSAPDFNPQRAAELQIPFDKAARAHPYPERSPEPGSA